ncbi:hypothetical protein CF95_gp154 [Erwinia phage PhiEaH1]|jgi:hypothetical protein|uniref:Uncharacterized protein n=1 Tax=Erwinia phage PhiEaH1 TaxID=1401669 RepID=W8CZN7_9CAUD|nr:hypothetical protein CF95_gp154 [Erwinia phage PhiEaH1]AGX01876.1 hypothetical protein [Erwinia phage PhiEaH1]WBF04686.1 hypothetical protein [Erwinia phage vB_Ea277G]
MAEEIATGVVEIGNGRFLVNDETAYDTACVIWMNRVYGEGDEGPDRVVETRPTRYPCEVLCQHENEEDGTVAIFTAINV